MDELFISRDLAKLKVLSIEVSNYQDNPVLILQPEDSNVVIPIWIGAPEAAAIVMQMSDQVEPRRPMTIDFASEILRGFAGDAVGRVIITGMKEGTFFAKLIILDLEIDARPSDLIALALKNNWNIECPRTLIDQVGVELEVIRNSEIEEFVAFLDSVEAKDFH